MIKTVLQFKGPISASHKLQTQQKVSSVNFL